jgi:hypothetical protein
MAILTAEHNLGYMHAFYHWIVKVTQE